MADSSFKVKKSLNIEPKASPSLDAEGDIGFNSTSHKLEVRDDSATRSVVTEDATQPITNKTIDADSNTITNIEDADIKAGAAIAYSKLALTDSIVNADINSAAAISYSKLNLAGSIVNADVNATAAIDYSKLALTDSIVNADIDSAAAIAYSKLNLAGSITDSDLNASAAISRSKVAAGTANHVVINDALGALSSEATLAKSRGGTGADNSSVTFPATGTIVTEDGTYTLTNKSIDADTNTISNIENADIKTGAAIDRAKLASGTTYRILANDVSGVMSENAALTAAHVVYADANGQLVGEATLSKSRGGSGQDNSSLTFPASGVLVTEGGTQTLTDKIISGASNTITNVSLTTGVTGTLPEANGGTNQSTYTTGDLLYASASNTLSKLAIGSSTQVLTVAAGLPTWADATGGSGVGGINYITNYDAETDTTGWATYADAAGTSPVDGTGGSPNVTITRTTADPLRGTGSFRITKDAANRQGQGVSYDFTIADADLAQVLEISFEYLASTNFAASSGAVGSDSDITVYLYDVTNAALIAVQPKVLTTAPGIYGKYVGTFQAAANSTSYRLIFHVASTNASSYTLDLDNVYVAPPSRTQGTPMTDWVSYTPTFNGLGTVTNISAKWRRVGDSIQILCYATAGTTSGVEARASLPTGLTSSTKIPSPRSTVGVFARGASSADACVTLVAPSVTYINFGTQSVSYAALTPNLGNQLVGSSENFSFEALFPIEGWSSQVEMSSEADTRVVALSAQGSPPTGTLSNSLNTIIYGTASFDTHGAYNSTTGIYTVPVSGKYRVSGSYGMAGTWAASAASLIGIYQNSTKKYDGLFRNADASYSYSGAAVLVSATGILDCVAGDTISLRSYTDATGAAYSSSTSENYFNIERISGPAAIAASETVAASYYASANNAPGANTQFNFDAKVFDTHNAVTTGVSWKFTAPASGIYDVAATWLQGSSTNFTLYLYKNGSIYKVIGDTSLGSGINYSGSLLVQLLAGDYIDLRPTAAGTITGGVAPMLSFIDIHRIGL